MMRCAIHLPSLLLDRLHLPYQLEQVLDDVKPRSMVVPLSGRSTYLNTTLPYCERPSAYFGIRDRGRRPRWVTYSRENDDWDSWHHSFTSSPFTVHHDKNCYSLCLV